MQTKKVKLILSLPIPVSCHKIPLPQSNSRCASLFMYPSRDVLGLCKPNTHYANTVKIHSLKKKTVSGKPASLAIIRK